MLLQKNKNKHLLWNIGLYEALRHIVAIIFLNILILYCESFM